MFDSSNTKQSVDITTNTTPSVLIKKNAVNSWMERFHNKSERADEVLRVGGHKAKKIAYSEPSIYDRMGSGYDVPDPDMDIIVLQCCPIGDGYLMVELAYRKDFIAGEVK